MTRTRGGTHGTVRTIKEKKRKKKKSLLVATREIWWHGNAASSGVRLPLCERTSRDISPQCYGVISRLRFGGTIEDVQRVIGSLSLSLSLPLTLIIKRTHLTPTLIIGLVDVTKGLSACVYTRAYSCRIGSKTQTG